MRLISRRSLQEPATCNSGGCVFATTLRSQPRERELLALLRQVRDLLEATPEGRRLRDLYWDISAELVDDVILDSRLRGVLSSRLTPFIPAVRAAVAAEKGFGDLVLSAAMVAEAERLQALTVERLSPETAARLDQEIASLRLRERIGTPIRRVLEDLGLRSRGMNPPAPRPQTLLVKLAQDPVGAVELRRGILSFGRPDLDTIFRRHEVRSMVPVFADAETSSGLRRVYKITLEEGASVSRLLQEARASRSVEYAELDGEMYALSSDAYFRYQYGVLPPASAVGGVNAVTAWNVSMGDPSVLVAVVDTGVDYHYADLAGRVRHSLGYDYADEDPDPMDDHGHGTHVAGVIAASVNNGFGIAGIAPRVTIIPMRVLGVDGQGSFSSVAAGIEAAARAGARLINLSLGSPDESALIEDALRYAYGRGSLPIAAAGNDGDAELSYPARSQYVLAVAAVDRSGRKASFSNYGPGLDLAAPGVNIVSGWINGETCYASGTSMAAPHVVGVAALVLSRSPGLTIEQLKQALTATARDAGRSGYDTDFGWGIVDASRALAN
ncbi:MAG TPA: S8 family peptidase [Thermoanaerobaculia bacterium]